MTGDFHPASETLAALADRTLTAPERESLMSHLSRCQQCRACLLFIASSQPAPTRWRAFPYRGLAVVLCLLPLLLFFTAPSKHPPRPEHTSAAVIVPAGLLHVSLATPPPSVLTQTFPAFPLRSPSRIVVQTERGERWLTLQNPLAPPNGSESWVNRLVLFRP